MKLRILSTLLALVALSVPAHAERKAHKAPKTDDAPAVAQATAPVAEEKKAEAKNLTKDEHAKLADARAKADQEPAVKAALEKKLAAQKDVAAARKADDATKLAEAKKAVDAAHAEWIAARRAAIAKTDAEAAKLDERAFEIGKRLRDAQQKGDDAEAKGKETAPGQLKKETGEDAKSLAPGRKKQRAPKGE